MPIDPRIALQYQPIQLPDPMAQLKNRLMIESAAQDTRLNALKMSAAEREMADEQRVRNYFTQNPNATMEDFASIAPGFGATGMARLKGMAEYSKERKLGQKAEGELFDQEMARSVSTLQSLDPNDPAVGQKLVSWHLSNHANPILGPRLNQMGVTTEQSMQAIGDAVQRGPQAVASLLGRMQMGAKDFAAAEVSRRNAATSEGNLAVSQQREARLAAQDKSLEDQSVLGHDALVNAATRYNIDGTMPPLGMGKAGAKTRGAILDMAAELAKGTDPADQRLRQISTKANTSALADLSKREAQVGAFERNFVRNADIVEKMSTKMDQSGSPIIQKWINAGKKKVGGDPDIAALDVAIKAVVNEYGKIVSGSMGNTAVAQSEIKRMEDLLNNANTTEQVIAILNTMRQETDNRMVGFKEEKSRLRGDISGKPAAAGAAAPAAPAAPTKPPGDKKPMRIGRFEVTPAG